MPNFVDSMRDGIESSFDELISQVNQWRSTSSIQSEDSESETSSSPITQLYQGVESLIDKIMGNCVVSWLSEQFQSVFNEIIEVKDFDAPNPIANFIQELITDFYDEISNTFDRIEATSKEIFGDEPPDLNDFSPDNLMSLMANFGVELIETIVQLVKKITIRILGLTKDLIGLFRGIIFANIRFPFIEKLVKFVTAGTAEVDTSFRIVDAITLVLAVILTTIYKIIFGEAPLKPGDVVSLPFEKEISVQSSMGTGQRMVNFISVIAQLTVNGMLIFAAFDKKSVGRKIFKVIFIVGLSILFITRTINAFWSGQQIILNMLMDVCLLCIIVYASLDAYTTKTGGNIDIDEDSEKTVQKLAAVVILLMSLMYAVVPATQLKFGKDTWVSDSSNLSDLGTGASIALGIVASKWSESPTGYVLAGVAALIGLAGFYFSMEYIVAASK